VAVTIVGFAVTSASKAKRLDKRPGAPVSSCAMTGANCVLARSSSSKAAMSDANLARALDACAEATESRAAARTKD